MTSRSRVCSMQHARCGSLTGPTKFTEFSLRRTCWVSMQRAKAGTSAISSPALSQPCVPTRIDTVTTNWNGTETDELDWLSQGLVE